MIKKKLLGQLLLEQRWVAESHIQQALQQQEGSHLKIGKILVKNQVLTEEKLCEALSLQLDLPYQKTLRVENVEFLPEQVSLSFLKENFMLPLKCANGVLYVATADPLNVQPLDALGAIFGKQARPVLSTEAEIEQAIYLFFQQNSEIPGSVLDDLEGEDRAPGAGKADDLLNLANEAPIIKLVNLIISQAVKEHASDVHIEPFEKKLRVRFRIDGLLYEILTPPKEYQAAIASRIKIMSQLNIAETRLPQDGKMSLKVAGKDIDIRVSVFPTAFGERIVLRLLNKTDLDFDLQNLGFAPETLERFRCVLKKPHGILLVTGPTGSGKSTTLYAALKTLNQSERNILTIEDPIEYQIAGVGQTQVKPSIGLTFAAGLRAILRQDPDVIMVGEIRDLETARIAIRAALTGHLVLSTLHTNDAASAAVRLIEMGVAAYLVAS
ncbi:MAG: GspE/PulE family protein, partial [bacterium]